MWRLVLLWLLAVAFALRDADAQDYPSRPVRLVVPASPGGGSDLTARLLAPGLAAELGQPFVVENRVTSGGIVGTQQVAESPPDGHTVLVTFDTFATNPYLYKNLRWDPLRDFAPVMQVCRYPQVLVVHPSLGVKTVKEFVALAKERGASLNYGSAGPGSSYGSRGRSTRTPRCIRSCAGSSAAASRRRRGRRSSSPTSPTARDASTTFRWWSGRLPRAARSIASAWAARWRESTR